ncbi:hypothetical protein BKA66DRAFT_474169 [Pyrenochaeta sp. MPI-SDFR-AT-0127]|nr:hypothetical protein BKA66DRAFT_474169 [Pyrenochaeta sp. MPI-SDFR-AT-0127]
MLHLPDDIIIAVATQIKRQSPTNVDLSSFILVCKRWHQLGLRLLYGNIALGNTDLKRFADSFDASKYGNEVRSLTLRIEKDHGTHPNDLTLFPASAIAPAQSIPGFGFPGFPSANDPPSNEPSLPDRIASIVPLISQFDNLISFSFRLEESAWRSIPRATIVAYLQALPNSCQHLELDTRGQDHRGEDEQVHICDNIRSILPRLQHARLRIGAMCCAMLGDGKADGALAEENPENRDGDENFEPVSLPNIKSLILNCGLPRGLQMQQCGQQDYTSSAKHTSWPGGLAWPAITEALRSVIKANTGNIEKARIYSVLGTDNDFTIQTCQTEIRIDMVGQETWTFPSMRLGRPFGGAGSYLLRLQDDTELVMAELEDIEEIAEGHIWRDVVGGARLPTEVLEAERNGLPTFATGCIERPLSSKTIEGWMKDNPGEPTSIGWRNEEMAGMKLMLAEKRTGDAYLDIRPIKEITPEGWVRTRDSILKRA